jgi:hypothetical protein
LQPVDEVFSNLGNNRSGVRGAVAKLASSV